MPIKAKKITKSLILSKIKKAGLVGRGGGCYPVWVKWEAVSKALDAKQSKEKKCYVVCNASEGEPDVKKDLFLLENHPSTVIDGMKIAMHHFGADKGIIFLNEKYYRSLAKNLDHIIGDYPIEIFLKPHEAGYIGGEESSLLNTIEGQRTEPRLRPPYPVEKGLWGFPTLVHNVETFYNISLVQSGNYKNTRFYTVTGDVIWDGVYEFSDDMAIEKILKETDNYPKFEFFAQIGGGASGDVLSSRQLNRPASGAGSITVYSVKKHPPIDVMRKWSRFFMDESCGQCTPCREGTYRLSHELNKRKIDWNVISQLLENLSDTAFCGLGCAIPIPFKSYVRNVLADSKYSDIRLPGANHQMLCECFK